MYIGRHRKIIRTFNIKPKLKQNEGFNDKQCDFRKEKSTIHAIHEVIGTAKKANNGNLLNEHLNRGIFPKKMKKANLVLTPKESIDLMKYRKFRPVCLLNVLEKDYEHMIRTRTIEELEQREGLSETECEFESGKENS